MTAVIGRPRFTDSEWLRAFLSRVDPLPNGCWQWRGGMRAEYGGTSRHGRSQPAHRAYYEFVHGPLPPHLALDHLCLNKLCVNPHHLEPVSTKVNIQRGRRYQSEKTHCPRGHAYDDANTYRYKGSRQCRACHRQRMGEQHRINAAGTIRLPVTHCPSGHPYDEANTYWWGTNRQCRACRRERAALRRATARITKGAQ